VQACYHAAGEPASVEYEHWTIAMPQRKKSWREKLADSKGLPKTGRITGKMTKRWGTGTMVVPAPLEVDAVMKRVPKGKLITISEIRAALAKQHGVNVCCPITTGIFAWISAHAAEEALDKAEAKMPGSLSPSRERAGVRGKKRNVVKSSAKITPYWRTLKTGGELNPKYPGGIAQLRKQLAAEGHHVIAKGKRFFVVDYQARLANISP
jgi:hypothetical protein